MDNRCFIACAAFIVLAGTAVRAEPVILFCHAGAGGEMREWTIRLDGDRAAPVGPSYDRLLRSPHPAQYINSRVTPDAIDIWIRDGNSGQQILIDRSTGALGFERMSDLNHTGTERVVEQASGTCHPS